MRDTYFRGRSRVTAFVSYHAPAAATSVTWLYLDAVERKYFLNTFTVVIV